MLNALTIDVEDYYQVHAFETVIDAGDWGKYPGRVAINTRRVLRLLQEFRAQATFFILGWVADRYPDLVQEIVAEGHEVATHGYWHRLIYRQTPKQFAADLEQSLGAIRRALNGLQRSGDGLRIWGYRAPAFSITHQSLWALDILREHGIRYDSSIFPLLAHDRYGISSAGRFAQQVRSGLWEFPVSTVRLANRNWPVAGGGYFRLCPLWLTQWAIQRINTEGQPAVIYLHPWEFDPDQPRIHDAPLLSRFRHYVNLDRTETRLRNLLSEFQFAPMERVFASYIGAC